MKTTLISIAAAGALTVVAGVTFAQMPDSGSSSKSQGQGMTPMMHGQKMQGQGMHGGSHDAASQPQGDQGPSSFAFAGVNAKMHTDMAIAYSGDPDKDFIRGMIPHHQGAVDMAKVVLAFGKDPEVRKLAETIIKAQEDEIAWMKAWLQKHGS